MLDDSVSDQTKKLFSGFSASFIERLLPLATIKELNEGDVLFEIGQASDAVYFVLSGRMAVKQKTGFEERMQVVGLLDPGAVLGEGCLAAQLQRSATVVAAATTSLVRFGLVDLLELIEDQPAVGVELYRFCLQASSIRLRENTRRMAYIL